MHQRIAQTWYICRRAATGLPNLTKSAAFGNPWFRGMGLSPLTGLSAPTDFHISKLTMKVGGETPAGAGLSCEANGTPIDEMARWDPAEATSMSPPEEAKLRGSGQATAAASIRPVVGPLSKDVSPV